VLLPGRRALLGVCVAGIVVTSALAVQWQRTSDELVGEHPPRPGSGLLLRPVQILLVGGLTFVVLVGVARLLRASSHRLARRLPAWVPGTVGGAVAAVVVGFTVALAVDQVLAHQLLAAVDRSFAGTNHGTARGVEPPTSTLRSGGPGSLIGWDQLGFYGRSFVAGGATVAQLTSFGGGAATEPIRVYGGLDVEVDGDLRRLASRVVLELERTGAFDRQVLCVTVPTGRGWVDNEAVEALEYLYHGDVATASMQYSYLPSVLAFLSDPQRAQVAGRELFDQVHRRWSRLPPERRPRLVVYGESLGSTGVQAAFSDLTDLERRTDGALFVGPPQSNRLWSTTIRNRDRGTPMVRPVYQGGRSVRFGATGEDLSRPGGSWGEPRIAFLQHASDPVVWWSPRLLFSRPDWLREPRGTDVNPSMRWYPVVTFWQVTADMAGAVGAPTGHGHHYGDFAEDWSRITPPPGWTTTDTARLTSYLEAGYLEAGRGQSPSK
jgi:uncharacterized membrane protein